MTDLAAIVLFRATEALRAARKVEEARFAHTIAINKLTDAINELRAERKGVV